MSKTFNLEMRVTSVGSVLSWEILLENTNASSRVSNWAYDMAGKYWVRTFEHYSINDDTLDVYAGAEGKVGGSITCSVLINNQLQNAKVISNNTDPNYAHETYSIA
ncbi:MAG: hypothetical protein JST82_01195 [Bacteroidetes bacterium]|nr:hypothetical protein [Bacteroidota bacterium]